MAARSVFLRRTSWLIVLFTMNTHNGQYIVPVVASIVLTFTQHVNGTTVKAKQNHRNETYAGGEYRRAEKQPLKRERYAV
jgi:membrane protein insertase Oxa1/YidC/SpoIIIJ